MNWAVPRRYFGPKGEGRSSELSVRRPLFCTAIFRRTGSGEFNVLAIEAQPFGDRPVAAVAGGEIAGDAADGGDADPGLPVDFAVGQAALQEFDHCPSIRHGLQFRLRAQIAEKDPALLDAA